jgi:glutamine synthetase
VARGSLEVTQAVQIVQDIFFNTSNRLYNLGLTLKPLLPFQHHTVSWKVAKIAKIDVLKDFLEQNPSIKYLRLQWLDYITTLKLRIIPIKLAVDMFKKQKSIGITKAALGLIHQDMMVPTFSPVGEYELIPCFESLRLGERDGYATVQGEFHEKDGSEVAIDPRSALRRIVQRAKKHDISFLVGFELEVVFMTSRIVDGARIFGKDPISHGHAWSNASALRNPDIMEVIEEIMTKLERSQINLEQFHPESAPGQYEFVTGCLPPLEAVDTLLATQDIIYSVAEKHSLKATFIPKPYPMACGTGAHVHMSITPGDKHPSFYAGILKHLPAIAAFTYSSSSSYDRVQDSVWSGGRHVAWGTQNRETPLRKVEGSHWEMKCMDGLANKYLALAAILGAGLQGVLDNQLMTHKDCAADPALLDVEARKKLGIVEQLPKDFPDALQKLDKAKVLRNIIGEGLVNVYLTIKYAEMEMLDSMEPEARRNFLLERY